MKTIEMIRGARKLVSDHTRVKPGENVLILTDAATSLSIAEVLAIACKEKGAEPVTKRIRSERSLSDLHWEDFLMAVQNRKQPACVIQDGFQSTSTVQLAMVALENSGSVKWNPATREVLENPDASRQLKRDYRSPWKHPFQV